MIASGRPGRDDGDAAVNGQGDLHVVGVVSLIADQAGRGIGDGEHRPHPLDVVNLFTGQEQCLEAALLLAERVDLGRASTARAANGLAAPPLFAPEAEGLALTPALSAIFGTGRSPQAARAANSSCHRARWFHRLNRVNTVVRGPYTSGSARQRSPSRNRCRIPAEVANWPPGSTAMTFRFGTGAQDANALIAFGAAYRHTTRARASLHRD